MTSRCIFAAFASVASLLALTERLCGDSPATFDGARAYEHVRRLVETGPRPPASEGIHRAQSYIIGQLKSFGCPVEEHDFHASSAIGDLAMKNIVVKLHGSGSGTGTMLELARLFCARKNALNVWIIFFDGEEAQGSWTDAASVKWSDSNATFGSREMAAQMALSGDLKRTKAMILADMIGPANVKIKLDTNSTLWLTDLIWSTAAQLGYKNNFVDENYPITGDDHLSFIRRGVAACDLIDFSVQDIYWHTPQDTLDKVDAQSLTIVGQVLAATLPRFEKKFR
jgi:glutaminyl-peptide cyclotransferase